MTAVEKVQAVRLTGPQRRGWRRYHVVRIERPTAFLTCCGLAVPFVLRPVVEVRTVAELAAMDDGPDSSASCLRCLQQAGVFRDEQGR